MYVLVSATLLMTFSAMATAQVKLIIQDTGLDQYGLKLITNHLIQFGQTLRNILGDQDVAPLQPTLKFSVIIQNGGSRNIAVIGVRFQIADQQGGRSLTLYRGYRSPFGWWPPQAR